MDVLMPLVTGIVVWRNMANKGIGKGKAPRMTLQVDAETHQALEAYSKLTDIPISRVAARCVREWMNTTGKVHLDVMQGKAGQPLVPLDGLLPMNSIVHAQQG